MAKKPYSTGKIIGITCGSIFGFFVILPLLTIALNLTGVDSSVVSWVVLLGVAAAVILIIRRQAKKPAPELEAAPVAAPVMMQPQQVPVVSTGGNYVTTVCQHSFSAEELAGKATISCPCGYKFKTKDLIEYHELRLTYLKAERELVVVRQRLVDSTAKSGANTQAQTSSVPAPPAKKSVKRTKASISLQQWLIMGASAIVVMAGSVFVSVNLNTLSSEAFLAVTAGVGIGTAVLAFWGRKFSVMLSNFMATFSSSMLMFSLLVVGDIFFPFTWDTAPGWWWGLDLLVVSAVAFVLTRVKSNFGWKLVSIAALAASGTTFSFGQIRTMFEEGSPSFAWFSAAVIFCALLVAILSTQLAKIKFEVGQGTSDLEYEKDLANREEVALQKFTSYTVALFGVLGFGYVVFNSLLRIGMAPEPLSFSAFAAVGVLGVATKSIWVKALSQEKETQGRISSWLHILAFTGVALGLSSWNRFIAGENLWAGVLGITVIAFAIVFAGFYIKNIASHSLAIQTAHFAVVGSWLLWYLGDQTSFNNVLAATGLLLVVFAMSLVYQSWLGVSRLTLLPASIFHFIGLVALVLSIRTNSEFNMASINYALVALGLVILSASYSPLIALVNRKLGKEFNPATQQLVFWFTALLTFVLTLPINQDSSPASYLFLLAVTGGSALLTGLVAASSAEKVSVLSKLLLRYSYAFQAISVLMLITASRDRTELVAAGILLIALASLNYQIAWLGKIRSAVWLAYGFSLGGLLLIADAQRDNFAIATHLALLIVISLLLNIVLRLVDKRVAGKYTTNFALISVFGLTISSLAVNFNKWLDTANSDQVWLGLALLSLVGVIAAGSAEFKRFSTGTKSTALRIAALAYTFVSFLTMASFPLNEELNDSWGAGNLLAWRRIFVGSLFALVVFRQLQISSREKVKATTGWFALSYLAPVGVALITSFLIRDHINLEKFNLEIYTIPLALALALPPLFNSAASKALKRLAGMDVPLLFPITASVLYSLTQDISDVPTAYRLVVSTAILAAYSWWRFTRTSTLLWSVLDYIGLVGLALSLAQLIEVLAPNIWDGPELFGVGAAVAVWLGNKSLKKVIEFKSSMFTHGLPLVALLIPSIIYTYTTLDISLELTSPSQITRIISVLVIAIVALLLGIRNGNLGIALAGGSSLSLIFLPITWVSAGNTADMDTTISLRALGISLFLFLFLGGLRSINKIPDSSYFYLGIPIVVALGPSLFLTIQSIGDPTITRVDWWRFGITMAVSITLLVVGSLRSLGGLFFPGLVGVVVGVLPYAFQPIARESWFLWVVLLLIAAVMVWIAVRLEQLRKLGKSGASWIKTLR